MPRMAEIKFSPAARADLKEIGRFSRREFGKAVADKYLLGLDQVLDRFALHPHSGETQPKLGKGVRRLSHRSHRIFYEVNGEVVLILRIYHHARDVKRSQLK